jgi:uncharacterized protein YgbK (DUF1537 family)
VLADDLTGASEVALMAYQLGDGVSSWLLPEGVGLNRATIATLGLTHHYAINMGTRDACVSDAIERQADSWDLLRLTDRVKTPQTLYKKIDSTLRGHWLAECEALLTSPTSGVQAIWLSPAFPAMGRTMVQGVQLLEGMPVHQAPSVQSDVTHRLATSDVALLVEQYTGRRPFCLTLEQLDNQPFEALFTLVLEQLTTAQRWIISDAANAHHLALASQLMTKLQTLGHALLPCGSTGFLEALLQVSAHANAEPYTPKPPKKRPLLSAMKPLVVSGSLNPVTLAQIDYLLHHQPNQWCLIDALNIDPKTEKRLTSVANKPPYLLATAFNRQPSIKVSPQQVAHQLQQPLERVLSNDTPNVIVVCGGETAQQVWHWVHRESGKSQGLKVVDGLSTTVALCWEAEAQRYWVFKSGNMGDTSLLATLLQKTKEKIQAL